MIIIHPVINSGCNSIYIHPPQDTFKIELAKMEKVSIKTRKLGRGDTTPSLILSYTKILGNIITIIDQNLFFSITSVDQQTFMRSVKHVCLCLIEELNTKSTLK